jgi:hypothetical protein
MERTSAVYLQPMFTVPETELHGELWSNDLIFLSNQALKKKCNATKSIRIYPRWQGWVLLQDDQTLLLRRRKLLYAHQYDKHDRASEVALLGGQLDRLVVSYAMVLKMQCQQRKQ